MKTRYFAVATALAVTLAAPAYAQVSGGTASAETGISSGAPNTGTNATVNTGVKAGAATTNPNTSTSTDGSLSATGSSHLSTTGSSQDTGNIGMRTHGTMSGRIPTNMSSQQFNSYVTGRWDQNGDGVISQSEWDTSSSSWYGSDSSRPFSSWDTNGDGNLGSDELNTTFSTSGLYRRYDTNNDGVIDSKEEKRIPR